MKESFAMVISLLHVKEREAEEIDFAGVEVNYSAIQGAWPAPVNLGSLTGDVDRHVVCLMLQVFLLRLFALPIIRRSKSQC